MEYLVIDILFEVVFRIVEKGIEFLEFVMKIKF